MTTTLPRPEPTVASPRPAGEAPPEAPRPPLWRRLRDSSAQAGVAATGLFAGWAALFSWSRLVVQPGPFLAWALVVGAVTVAVGLALRVWRRGPFVVVPAQVAVALLGLNAVASHQTSYLGLVPTRDSLRHTLFLVVNGAASLNQYSSPVQVNPRSTTAMLLACGLAVIVAVDVLAGTLRRPPLAAIPLLVTLSVPVSILRDPLAWPVFVAVGLLFLRLLSSEHLARLSAWGGDDDRPPTRAKVVLWQVSLAAVVVALLAAPLVPLRDPSSRGGGGGGGDGTGSAGADASIRVNPFISLRRDLVDKTHTPLMYAETTAATTGYVRTTVLDRFTSTSWLPTPRDLPPENSADGKFPTAPGQSSRTEGTTDTWKFHLLERFDTAWLPLPYPVLSAKIPDGWRFDSRTLDVAFVGDSDPTPLDYTVTALSPDITAQGLRDAEPAPEALRTAMTTLPGDFPSVLTQRAKQVTAGATTDYDRAVALQEWFRTKGGFTYSLDQRGGSGMDLLAHFVTDDRVGYCEQFASAMAAMGRALGIPSRVVVGFQSGQSQPDGRVMYTTDERHAWPEMYFGGIGWVRFEPTPGQRTGASPPWTRVSGEADQTPQAPAAVPQQTSRTPRDLPEPASVQGDTSSGLPWQLPVGAGLLLLVLVTPGVVRQVQRRRRLGASDPRLLAEGAWQELRASAIDVGVEWPERRSPREQAQRVREQVAARRTGKDGDAEANGADDLDASLRELLTGVERGRYAAPGTAVLTPERRAATVEAVTTWRTGLRRTAPRSWRAWYRRTWPRSVLRWRG